MDEWRTPNDRAGTSKVLLLGDSGVGKTSIAIQLVHNAFLALESPDGKYDYHCIVDGQYKVVYLLDNVESEDWGWSDQIIRECTAFMLVYSITSRASFDSISAWMERVMRAKGEPTGPIVIVGNKADREDLREVSYSEADILAHSYQATLFEVSARTRYNIEQAVLAATAHDSSELRLEWIQKKTARAKLKGKKIPNIPPMSTVPSTYGSDMLSISGDAAFSDIEFEANGEVIPGHSVILAAHSPRFMRPFIKDGQKIKSVHNVDEEIFRCVMDWIYGSAFPKPDETDIRTYIKLYNAAVQLGVDSLAAVTKSLLKAEDYYKTHTQYAVKGAVGMFLDSKLYSDISLIIDGKEIRAHKAVLVARSIHWRQIISDYERGQAEMSQWEDELCSSDIDGLAGTRATKQSLVLIDESSGKRKEGTMPQAAIIFISLLHSPCLQAAEIFPNTGMTRSASSPSLSAHNLDAHQSPSKESSKKKSKKKVAKSGELQLHDVYHSMITYIYTDTAEITPANALEIFLLALDYELIHLAYLAAQVILDSITVQTAITIYDKLLGIHQPSTVLTELKKKIELWISFRYKAVSKTKAFKKFRTRHPSAKAELKQNQQHGFSSTLQPAVLPDPDVIPTKPSSPLRKSGGNTSSEVKEKTSRGRTQRLLNSSMPAVPTTRSNFFTSPRAATATDDPEDELIDLYDNYQDYKFAKSIQETRLPVLIQRKKWKKHISDYVTSLEEAKEEFGTINLSHGHPRKLMFVPDEIKEISGSLKKLKLDDNLITNNPIIVYDRYGREQERIEPLSFEGMRAMKVLSNLSLAQNNLRTVPPAICHLSMLTNLNLSLCNITVLPPHICYLHALERLTLFGNKLTKLPASLCLMRNLKKLDLASNDLNDQSTKPGYFPHSLTSLTLANNQWTSFPLGIVIKAEKEEVRKRSKEDQADLRSSGEFFRFLSEGGGIHLQRVMSGGELGPDAVSEPLEPMNLPILLRQDDAARERRGTADLYRSLGKGADKYIREQKLQQELLRFVEQAIKREKATKQVKQDIQDPSEQELQEREERIFQRLLRVESGEHDIEVRPLENLVQLNLDGNNISSLPEELHQLSSLRYLRLCDNYSLSHLPNALARMPQLEELVIPLELPVVIRDDQIPVFQDKVSPSVWRTLMDFIEVPIPHPITNITGPLRLIPDELQLRILSYISQIELSNTISLVCRHWHILANDDSLWPSLPWKLLTSSRQDRLSLERRIRRLCIMHPNIVDLSLRNTSCFSERAAKHLVTRCHKLKKIDLDNSMNYYKSHLGPFLDIITQNLSMLRFLSCQNCYMPYQTLANLVCAPRLNRLLLVDCEFSAYSSAILTTLPDTLSLSQLSFERSRIDSTALAAIVSRLINVTDLNLSACELSADVLNAIGERCRSLQILNISHTNITAQDITQLLRRRGSLTSLNIRDIPNILSSYFTAGSTSIWDPQWESALEDSSLQGDPTALIGLFASNFSQMRALTISTTTENEPTAINPFVQGLALTNTALVTLSVRSTALSPEALGNLTLMRTDTLRKIDLSCCNRLDAKGIITVITNCKRIEALNLNFLPQLNDSALMEISRKHSTSLRVLSLYQCSSITDDGVLAIIFRCSRLRFLSLTKTAASPRSVRSVPELTELQVLCLSSADVELLKKIAQCPSLKHLVLDPFAVIQVGAASSMFSQHTAINEYSEQKLLQMYWQLL